MHITGIRVNAMDTGNNWDQNKWNQDNGNGSRQNNGWDPGSSYNGYGRQQPGAAFITAAYVLGILSIVTTFLCTVYLPYIFGSLSIIFALLSKGNATRTAQRAASGIRCAILGMIMNTALIIACFTLVFTNPQIHEELNEMTRQIYGHSFDEIMQDIEKGESPDLTQGTGSFN
jgi:hypothetical protein